MVDNLMIYSAMQEGTPTTSFIKTILGKVYIVYWDSFTNQPSGMLLEGDPRKLDERSIVDLWSTQEEVFFKRMNKEHLKNGVLIPFERKEEVHEKTTEESSDEELSVIINSKFYSLQNKLNSIYTTPVLFRMINLARELEKSEKIIRAIEARLSEVQLSDSTQS